MMFNISAQDASDAFWQRLARQYQGVLRCVAEALVAPYVERSIPLAACLALTALSDMIRPKIVIEIGTGIGRSTNILTRHSDHVYTCDTEDHMPSLGITGGKIHRYKDTTSTDMLRQLPLGTQADLIFIDGRVQQDDISLLAQHRKADSTVFVLDDTEGIEKGMVNSLILTGAMQNLFFLPPPTLPLFEVFGVIGKHTLGLLVPSNLVNLVRQ